MMRLAAAALLAALSAPAASIPIGGAGIHAGAALDAGVWTRLPHVTAAAVDHEGRTGRYEGIALGVVLADAGSLVGDAVRGAAARTYVVVTGHDGYAAVFALAELETSETRCAPLVAEARDDAPLPAGAGPVQIVAPCDRTHARWVRDVASIALVAAAPPA